jgi:hypothetical protein
MRRAKFYRISQTKEVPRLQLAGKALHYGSSISREEFPRRRPWNLIGGQLKLVRKMRLPYKFFVAQAPTRSSAFSMFSIELATLKRR